MDGDDFDYMTTWDLTVDYFICFGVIVLGLTPIIIGYWHYQ